ncbi:hypothetical protein GQ54DRAFT_308367 [Martensiomyces pterosporus]|nr:hypothetical protein GQ54DRAFT_308367 [Martensiomyces pterosporus]
MKISRTVPPVFFGALAAAMSLVSMDASDLDISQVPRSLYELKNRASGELTLSRRITSVRPGDLMQVSLTALPEKHAAMDFSELIATVYSTDDGNLVRVLGKIPANQVAGLKNAEPRGRSNVKLYIPVHGLSTNKAFTMYKLALIAPESDSSGLWKKYAADTMLFGYDGAR